MPKVEKLSIALKKGKRSSVEQAALQYTSNSPGGIDEVLNFLRGVLTRFVLKYTLRVAHLELGGVDLDLAVEDDVLSLDWADMTPQGDIASVGLGGREGSARRRRCTTWERKRWR